MTGPSWDELPRLMSLRLAARAAGIPASTFRHYLNTTPGLEAALVFRPGGDGFPQGSRRVKREPLRRWLEGADPLPETPVRGAGPLRRAGAR